MNILSQMINYLKIDCNQPATQSVSINSYDNLKPKLEDNYGYLVVTLDELKEIGLLSVSDKNINDLIAKGEEYKKAVIVDSKYNFNGITLLNYKLGLVDIIYPFVENTPFAKNLDEITIEYDEVGDFQCDSLLDGGIEFLNKKNTLSCICKLF